MQQITLEVGLVKLFNGEMFENLKIARAEHVFLKNNKNANGCLLGGAKFFAIVDLMQCQLIFWPFSAWPKDCKNGRC